MGLPPCRKPRQWIPRLQFCLYFCEVQTFARSRTWMWPEAFESRCVEMPSDLTSWTPDCFISAWCPGTARVSCARTWDGAESHTRLRSHTAPPGFCRSELRPGRSSFGHQALLLSGRPPGPVPTGLLSLGPAPWAWTHLPSGPVQQTPPLQWPLRNQTWPFLRERRGPSLSSSQTGLSVPAATRQVPSAS